MDYNTELTSLQDQVNQFDTTSPTVQTLDTNNEQVTGYTGSIWNNKYFEYGLYVGIPIIIIGLITAIRPSFAQDEYVNEDGEESMRTNWVKVLSWGVMLSIPLVVGLYIFMRKKKKTS